MTDREELRTLIDELFYYVDPSDREMYRERIDALLAGPHPPSGDVIERVTTVVYRHVPVYNSVDLCECGQEFTPGHLADRLADAGLLARPVSTDDETEHVIEFREDGCTIKHPLSCRPNLFDCRFNRAAESMTGPPNSPGRYVCDVDDRGGLYAVRAITGEDS